METVSVQLGVADDLKGVESFVRDARKEDGL